MGVVMCYILYQKGSPSFSPLKAFYLATLGGARALHLEDKIGSFLVGKEAVFKFIFILYTESD
jgi:guanine deaminase